ncbi:hypothetical protein SBA5_790007 [Candidatus Sulfotelmatomonas gaucii]|uniref:Uncharacterized protein n=1 Tax=Candidatus Sulfuritelmatomonas gaucii TaxID=2043161 RepID=A0A2N9M4M9_9BACT|nr:hypothetical protein SBA5_790007 [Candidatus Sulfotelmatomonas gaucii]
MATWRFSSNPLIKHLHLICLIAREDQTSHSIALSLCFHEGTLNGLVVTGTGTVVLLYC